MATEDSGAPVVVVTGAAGGIGSATVALLVDRGARVVAIDRNGDRLHQLADEIGGGVTTIVADVSDEQGLRAAFDATDAAFGRLDGLFNNAGVVGEIAPVADGSADEFERVMRINVLSQYLGIKHGLPLLRRTGGGSIVNTASTGGMTGAPGLAAYIASKHAVIGLTRTVALEVAHEGIVVNALAPGMVDTPMLAGIQATSHGVDYSACPMNRPASPLEIAQATAWLLLDRPPYLTGAVIPIDGAFTAQ